MGVGREKNVQEFIYLFLPGLVFGVRALVSGEFIPWVTSDCSAVGFWKRCVHGRATRCNLYTAGSPQAVASSRE